MNAERAIVPSIQSPADAALHGLPGDGPAQRRRRMETVGVDRKGKGSPLLDFVQKNTLAAFQESQKKEAALKTFGSPQAGYPSFQLARMFHLVAQLIRADVGIRIFCTELGGQEPGGFDTHAGQAANHGALLEQLSESVAAFLKDLKQDRLLDRVLLMTYSEFGRTVLENGRRGTDHGSAAPLFLAGGRVKGGLVGSHPDLKNLENGGQKHHTDFRRVYATVLENWLGIDSQTVLEGRFKALDVIQG
jgi:uncharacterized protein (DUF1501 family)